MFSPVPVVAFDVPVCRIDSGQSIKRIVLCKPPGCFYRCASATL